MQHKPTADKTNSRSVLRTLKLETGIHVRTEKYPSYMEKYLNRFLMGDTLKVMRKLPDACVDLVVTSPPYNLQMSDGTKIRKGYGIWKGCKLVNGYEKHSDNMPHDEYVFWQRECLTEMLRVVKDDGAVFYNHKWRVKNGLLLDNSDIVAGFPVRQIIIWQRTGGINFTRSYFLPTYEVIYLIAKPDFRLAPKGSGFGDVWTFTQDKNNEHPAPFPATLVKRIISSTDARLVLDPFMGSGTTALAAKILGRDFIGIDNSPKYIAMAKDRLKGYIR